MKVIIFDSTPAVDAGTRMGDYAADLILKRVSAGLSVLGVATGSSPLPIYRSLHRKAPDTMKLVTAFALDEYVGLPREHSQSYATVINSEVTVPLGLDPSRVHVPDGTAVNIEQACIDYDLAIAAAGGIDLQILGIGDDSHIGFNEPTSSFGSRTRVKTLTSATRSANARFFDSVDDVPHHCITQGLGTIMEAREVILIAQGQHKAAAVAAAIEGPIASVCPGSILQMHPRVTMLIDGDAASALRMTDYYNYVEANKPVWQN